jgi:hypothetical protein
MPESTERLITIGEIAAGARHLVRDPFAFNERCRHWARLGLLRAVKQVGKGAGRHALFPLTETYMAGVVAAFAEIGLHPAASRPLADAQSVARKALTTWLVEKGRKPSQPQAMRLEMSFFPGGDPHLVKLHGPIVEEALAPKANGLYPTGQPIITVTLNFDSLFESVFERLLIIDGGVLANKQK